MAPAAAGSGLAPGLLFSGYRDNPMPTMLQRLAREEAGQDFAEYGIALAVITGVAVLIAVAIGQDVQTLWQAGQNAVVQVVNP
jgi:Flp pilus assembly pilin Flp